MPGPAILSQSVSNNLASPKVIVRKYPTVDVWHKEAILYFSPKPTTKSPWTNSTLLVSFLQSTILYDMIQLRVILWKLSPNYFQKWLWILFLFRKKMDIWAKVDKKFSDLFGLFSWDIISQDKYSDKQKNFFSW